MELILEYLANRLKEGDCICNLGEGEMQIQHLDNLPSNIQFNGSDRLYESIQRILNLYYKEEQKHWEEENYPLHHIYIDLCILKNTFKSIKNKN